MTAFSPVSAAPPRPAQGNKDLSPASLFAPVLVAAHAHSRLDRRACVPGLATRVHRQLLLRQTKKATRPSRTRWTNGSDAAAMNYRKALDRTEHRKRGSERHRSDRSKQGSSGGPVGEKSKFVPTTLSTSEHAQISQASCAAIEQ